MNFARELSKQYNPKEVEDKIFQAWEKSGKFHAQVNKKKKPYTIVIPPPNITGILHMGHALNNTIQDILIRYYRMKDCEALWMPGTDHAGIATQNVVERKLTLEKKTRHDIGREKFVKEVWKWQKEYGSTIIHQLKKIGASCDWERERFTMDKEYSEAVLDTFIHLYEKGLIYRGNYIINWCPRCHTALSDEESEHRDMDGKLWHIKYPLEDNKNEYLVVATTRPETMLGDVAVAVNPKDKRYKHLIGKNAILPILNRPLKIVADDAVDMKFGTGCLKITPAHDPNDFAIARRHGLEAINVMNEDATINEIGKEYEGMDRYECREAILEELIEHKLLVKTDNHQHAVGHCYRCHSVVEPRLSLQWFVKMKPLAKPAIKAVKANKIKFYPQRWEKVYLEWMENIRDWCISRQIWWGHRIPVYYCQKCEEIIVSKAKPKKCPKCGSTKLEQDPDVLDTWFSSWLWPFAVFKDKKDREYFYPTNCLVTAQEIIFFWVARMIMAGYEFMGKEPFQDIYIHGTVRDDTGTKMSKSLGNVIDPLEIIEQFGADALRYSIISITAAGQDVFLSPKKFEVGRNFANKIWNLSRFIIMNLDPKVIDNDLCVFFKKQDLVIEDHWILSRLFSTLKDTEKAYQDYRFNDAAKALYDFIWHDFCDWYVELAKPRIKEPETQFILYKVLEKALRALNPIMPFITEEIWNKLPHQSEPIIGLKYPHIQENIIDKKVEKDMKDVIELIYKIRNIRSEMNIPLNKLVSAIIAPLAKENNVLVEENAEKIIQLAKLDDLKIDPLATRPKHSATAITNQYRVFIPLEGIIDVEQEKERLEKEMKKLITSQQSLSNRLNNDSFLAKAPKEVIAAQRETLQNLDSKINNLKESLESLN